MSDSDFQVIVEAVEERNVKKVKKYIKSGGNILSPDGKHSLFHVAAKFGCTEIIEALSDCKDDDDDDDDDINYGRYPDGWTPLFVAARFGHVDTIKTLSVLGADVNTPSNDGYTPVFIAAQQGFADTVRTLCELGANFSTPDRKSGATPMYVAAQNDHITTINILAGFGTDVNTPQNDGTTEWSRECYKNSVCFRS